MELVKKEREGKKLKLALFPQASEEISSNMFEDSLQYEEFQLEIYAYHNLKFIFSEIKEYLSKQAKISKLSLKFLFLNNLSFRDSLYQLIDCTSLVELDLNITSRVCLKGNLQYSLGECLEQFINLQKLNITLNNEHFGLLTSCLVLESAYKKLINLTTLSIILFHIIQGQSFPFDIIRGLGQLQRLEILNIEFHSCRLKFSTILYTLTTEMSQLCTLKDFSLNYYLDQKNTNPNLHILQETLSRLKNLQKIKLDFGTHFLTNLQINNLKYLDIKIPEQMNYKLEEILDSLGSQTNLLSVNLSIQFSEQHPKKSEMITSGKKIAKISSLSHLAISFNYWCQDSLVDIIQFLAKLKQLKFLKSLSINLSSLRKTYEVIQNIQNDLEKEIEELFNNLLKFKFSFLSRDKEANMNHLIILLKAIQNSKSLEELYLRFNDEQRVSGSLDLVNINLLSNKKNLKNISIQMQKQYQISKEIYIDMMQNIANNNQLTYIYLNFYCHLDYDFDTLKSLGDSLTNLNSLSSLDLFFSYSHLIDESGFLYFCRKLSEKHSLEMLKLQNIRLNKVSLNTIKLFFSLLKNLVNLQILILSIKRDSLSDIEKKELGDSFKLPPKIIKINLELDIGPLSYNALRNTFQEISQLRQLQVLYLNFQQFEINNEQCVQFCNQLSNLKILQNLDFHFFSLNLLYLGNLLKQIQPLIRINFQYKNSNSRFYKMNSIVKEQNLEKQVKNENQIEPLNIFKEKLAIKTHFDKQKDTTEKQIGDLEQLRFVFDNISSLTQLILLLQSSHIGSSFCFQIFDSLMNLSNLEYLFIEIEEDNQIENENLIYLGKVLSSLQNIILFSLAICSKGNNIEWDDQMTPFYQSIKTLQKLECLSINIQFDYNPLTNYKQPNLTQLFHIVKCLSKLNNLTLEFKNYAQFYSISHLTSLKEMLFSLKNSLKFFKWITEKDQILLKTNQSLFLDCLLQLTHLQTLTLKDKIKNPLYKLPRLVSLLTAQSGGFKFW